MKAIYNGFAVVLMIMALFCVLFALSLANDDEVKTLSVMAILSIGFSLWFLNHDGDAP